MGLGVFLKSRLLASPVQALGLVPRREQLNLLTTHEGLVLSPQLSLLNHSSYISTTLPTPVSSVVCKFNSLNPRTLYLFCQIHLEYFRFLLECITVSPQFPSKIWYDFFFKKLGLNWLSRSKQRKYWIHYCSPWTTALSSIRCSFMDLSLSVSVCLSLSFFFYRSQWSALYLFQIYS